MARRGRGAAGRPAARAGGWRAGDAGSHATLSNAHRPRLRGGDRGDREASRSRAGGTRVRAHVRAARSVAGAGSHGRQLCPRPSLPQGRPAPIPSPPESLLETTGRRGPQGPESQTRPCPPAGARGSTAPATPVPEHAAVEEARAAPGPRPASRTWGGRGQGPGGWNSRSAVSLVSLGTAGAAEGGPACGSSPSPRGGSCSSDAPCAGEELGAGRRRRGPRRHALAGRDSSAGARGARASFREAGSTSRRAAAHGQGDGADRTGLRFSPVWAKDDVRGAS